VRLWGQAPRELQRIYLSQYLKLQFSILSTANTCQAMRVRRNFMMLDAQKTSIAIRVTSGKVIIANLKPREIFLAKRQPAGTSKEKNSKPCF
jgi:hypothetical protein